ncbi:hypothetical protein ACUTAF_06365 [Pseudomonas sp. SP16.1]|uniref:hypothetical protein n=1 Tax=Pseudomonas sp. SP16.1 TaxID=3458854 RepID=UPI0040464026
MPHCLLHTRPLSQRQLEALLPQQWGGRLRALAPAGERWLLRLDESEAQGLAALLTSAWLRRLVCAAC